MGDVKKDKKEEKVEELKEKNEEIKEKKIEEDEEKVVEETPKKTKKVSKRRSTKSKIITVLLGISFFCVLSFLLLVIFDNNGSKEVLHYHIVEGEEFDFYEREGGPDKELVKSDKIVSFSYPVFDLDGSCAQSANVEIEKKYKNIYDENFTKDFDETRCVAIKKGDKFYSDEKIYSYVYNVSENDKFVSITLILEEHVGCGGINHYYDSFVIDKTTKKYMNQKDLVDYFNVSEAKVIEQYNKNIGTYEYEKANNIYQVELVIFEGKLNVVMHSNENYLENV